MKLCTVPGCNRSAYGADGLCTGHHTRLKRWGDVRADRPLRVYHPVRQPCAVETCWRMSAAQGLCRTHYRRLRQYGSPLPLCPVRKGRVRQPSPAAMVAHR